MGFSMRCRLCGRGMDARRIFCGNCQDTLNEWEDWAAQQEKTTKRWPKVTIDFAGGTAKVVVDSSGGHPDPNEFVEIPLDAPPRQLGTGGEVHIAVPQDGRAGGSSGLASGDNADLVFYLRLKATPGCVSKLDLTAQVMNLYITPGSDAAKLFVQRMMAKYRALPEGDKQRAGLLEYKQRLLGDGNGNR